MISGDVAHQMQADAMVRSSSISYSHNVLIKVMKSIAKLILTRPFRGKGSSNNEV